MKDNKNNHISINQNSNQKNNNNPHYKSPSFRMSIKSKTPTIFTTSSESIIYDIINKLISKAITTHHISQIEQKLSSYCYNSIHREITSLLSLHLISYDKDESFLTPPISCNQSIITYQPSEIIPKYEEHINPLSLNFFNNSYVGENNWESFSMPLSSVLDRDTPDGIPFQQIKKPFKANMLIDSDQINEEDKTITDHSKLDERNSIRKSPYKPSTLNKSVKEELLVNKKKKKKNIDAVMPVYDIPKEPKKYKEVSTVDILREEKINELKINAKAKEDQMRIEKERIESNMEKIKKQQELSRKNVTVDANGKLVEVKHVVVDCLVPEFQSGMSATNKGIIINNPCPLSSSPRNGEEAINNKEIKPIHYNKSVSPIKKAKNKIIIRAVIPEILTYKMLAPSPMELKYMEQESRNTKFPPAGSCFDQIKLEVGVELTENTKIKSGGKDFHKKYRKYSCDTFKETNDTYNNTSNHHKGNNNNQNIMPNIVRNSKIGTGLGIIKEENTKGNNAIVYPVNNGNNEIGCDEIKLMTNNSIKNVFDKLDLIYEKDEESKGKISKAYSTSTHFFKQGVGLKIMNTTGVEQKKYDEMMKFNTTIMSNKNWGTAKEKNKQDFPSKKLPVKPQQKTIEQEIGMKIVQTKLPRARMFSYIKSPINNDVSGDNENKTKKKKKKKKMERTASTGFYKVVGTNDSHNKIVFSKTSSEKFFKMKANI